MFPFSEKMQNSIRLMSSDASGHFVLRYHGPGVCACDVVAVAMMKWGKVMPEGSSVGSTSPDAVK